MSILISQNILNSICQELSNSTESFLLVSAYCKLPLVKYFDDCLKTANIDKKLIVRFRPEDIVSGASDLDIYPYCRDNGWKLYFRLDLHAKTYIFDRLRCIIGSANATSSGLSIGGSGNYEMATTCKLDEKDVKALDLLLLGSVEFTDEIYSIMNSVVDKVTAENRIIEEWPTEIKDLFVADYSLLFAEDFPPCSYSNNLSDDELLFLNLNSNSEYDIVVQAFSKSKSYLWLLDLVKNSENKEMYFGAVTAKLHETLLNEPKPYRRDVKQLLSNLLSWIIDLEITELTIDRPNHSQRIRYINFDKKY